MMSISPSSRRSSYSQPCQRRIAAGSRSAFQTVANGAAIVVSTATARFGHRRSSGVDGCGMAAEHERGTVGRRAACRARPRSRRARSASRVGEALDVGGRGEAHVGLDREREQPRAPRCRRRPASARRRARRPTPRRSGARRRSGPAPRRAARRPARAGSTTNASARAARMRSVQPRRCALLDELEQPGVLQRAEVVVDALAAEAELGGEPGGGGRLAQPLEQPAADGGERGRTRSGSPRSSKRSGTGASCHARR